MKITTEPPAFQPITLKITFESKEEIIQLYSEMHHYFMQTKACHGGDKAYRVVMGHLLNLMQRT